MNVIHTIWKMFFPVTDGNSSAPALQQLSEQREDNDVIRTIWKMFFPITDGNSSAPARHPVEWTSQQQAAVHRISALNFSE